MHRKAPPRHTSDVFARAVLRGSPRFETLGGAGERKSWPPGATAQQDVPMDTQFTQLHIVRYCDNVVFFCYPLK